MNWNDGHRSPLNPFWFSRIHGICMYRPSDLGYCSVGMVESSDSKMGEVSRNVAGTDCWSLIRWWSVDERGGMPVGPSRPYIRYLGPNKCRPLCNLMGLAVRTSTHFCRNGPQKIQSRRGSKHLRQCDYQLCFGETCLNPSYVVFFWSNDGCVSQLPSMGFPWDAPSAQVRWILGEKASSKLGRDLKLTMSWG